jgi:hypothetical protein
VAAVAARPLDAKRMTPPVASRRATVRDVVVAAAVFIIASVVLLRAAATVPFHGDESEWINSGRYFKFVFLDHDVTSSVWRPSWLNRDQPPVGRYAIGAIIWASGSRPDQVNRSYAWDKDYAANLEEGRVPGPNLLEPVRRTMAIIGALSIVLLFVAGRLVGGTLVGAVAALCATSSPLLQQYLVQARSESLLALISGLALVGTLLVARQFRLDGTIRRVGWLVGPLLGLALATKLTAALAIVAVCAYGGVVALARLRTSRPEAIRMLVWAFTTGAAATVVWVTVNPFLWADPVGRTWSMLEQQQSIMVEQGAQFGNPVDVGFPQRVGLLVYRTFVENSTPAFDSGRPPGSEPLHRRTFSELPVLFGTSVELLLAAIGLVALVARAVRTWTAGELQGTETVLLWWLGVYALGIAANLSLDWPRYYVPTAFYGALLIGLGADAAVAAARYAWAGRQRTGAAG